MGINVVEEIGERSIVQFWEGVLFVPLRNESSGGWDQISVLHLCTVEQDDVWLVCGLGISLQVDGQGLANRIQLRRQAKQGLHLLIVARIPKQNFLAIRPHPPER